MLGWTGLKLQKKITLFERTPTRKINGLFPYIVVGKFNVYVGIEVDGELVSLARDSLAPSWRASLNKMTPLSEWNDSLVFTVGLDQVGMFDVQTQRLAWTIDTRLGRSRWRDVLVLGDKLGFTMVDPATGHQSGAITASDPSNFIVCGDVAVFDKKDVGDPVRAVNLVDGSVVWERNLFEEIRAEYGIDYRSPILAMTPGSSSDRFIGTRGSATLAFSIADGRILWKADVTVPYWTPIVVEGRIPILELDRFVVIDETTGTIVADQKHDELSSMVHARRGSNYGDTVAFVSKSGHVAVLNMNDGSLLSSKHYPVKFIDAAVADGRLLVTGTDGKLWVFAND